MQVAVVHLTQEEIQDLDTSLKLLVNFRDVTFKGVAGELLTPAIDLLREVVKLNNE